VLTLYRLHLLIPLLVIADALVAWRHDEFGRFETVAFVAGCTWLTVGLAVLLVGALRHRLAPVLPRIVLATYTSVFTVTATDVLAARFFPDPQDRRVYLRIPNQRFTRHADPATMPGIDATTVFTVNRLGLRGPDNNPAPGSYRVITVGGSATECLNLDDTQEWPRLVMDGLNRDHATPVTWLANAGQSGDTAVHHLFLLKSLPVLDEADAWIIMPGINDFQDSLARGGRPTQDALTRVAERRVHGVGMRLSKARIILPLRRVLGLGPEPATGEVVGDDWYLRNRGQRSRLPTLPLPDLSLALAEYHERLLSIGAECQARQKRCVFLTQPTMWRPDLPPEVASLMWFGWIGPRSRPQGYASLADLAGAMARYNDVLLQACRQMNAECLDLAESIPKDTSAMFDDCHFNANGARLVADVIVRYLRARAPFVH